MNFKRGFSLTSRIVPPPNLRFPAPLHPARSLFSFSVFFRGMSSSIEYPQTRRDDLVEDLHGFKVADSYRSLEDPKSPDTAAFIAAQNTLCDDYISQFEHVEAYHDSLTKTYDYERFGIPFRKGKNWYYSYNEGLRAQAVYYTVEGDAIDTREKGKVFFDPSTLSEDGTLALNTHAWSKDGTLYVYALSQSGSDWCYAKIRQIETGEDFPEKIEWLKFTGLNFTHDNKGFFYQRLPEPVGIKDAGTETGANRNAMSYYHVLGTPQSEDILVYSDKSNPEYMFSTAVTFDGQWLRLSISKDTSPSNKFWLAKLDGDSLPEKGTVPVCDCSKAGGLEWVKVKDDFEGNLRYVANNDNVFYFESNLKAPNSKVVRYDLDHPEKGFVTVVPEQPAVLESVALANQKYLVLTYLHNVQNKVFIAPLESLENATSTPHTPNGHAMNGDVYVNGSIKHSFAKTASHSDDEEWIGLHDAEQIDLPIGCSVSNKTCRRDDPRIFIHCVGFTLAGRVYKYTFHVDESSETSQSDESTPRDSDSKSFGSLTIWRESSVDGFDPEQWTVDQVWVPNPNDGVEIPMYIVRCKQVPKSKDTFCLLYGYGGFNISITPWFSPTMAAMLTHSGGLYCVANIRGGGEFGEEWHKAAIREKRPVAFADFEECGRYLIREGWTRKEKLVCQGASNGGALVGAVMNRTGDEIFAAGIAQVGVLDLLRYHLFTIGYAWKSDYGDPDVKEDFEFIYKWSPYHNVRDGTTFQYPAILCETSDHDDRVVPLHSFKFMAALQHAAGKTNRAPLLLRHHLKAGHGAGKPTKKVIEEASQRFAFMMNATGTVFLPRKGGSGGGCLPI